MEVTDMTFLNNLSLFTFSYKPFLFHKEASLKRSLRKLLKYIPLMTLKIVFSNQGGV